MAYPPYPQQRMPQPMPMPQQPPAAQPPQNVQEKKSADLDDDLESVFGDKIRRNMNKQFDSEKDFVARASIVMDFEQILERHPQLADNPKYKPYVDAFMTKFLNDPSSMVRSTALLIMEMGLIQHPSQPMIGAIQKTAAKDDTNLTQENKRATDILSALQNGTLGKDLIEARNNKDKDKNKKEFQSPTGAPDASASATGAMTKGAGQAAGAAPPDPSQQAAPNAATPEAQNNPAADPTAAMANAAAGSNPMAANPLAAVAGNQNWAQALQQAQPSAQAQTPQQATPYSPAIQPGSQYPSYYGMNGYGMNGGTAAGYPGTLPTAYAQTGQNAYLPNRMTTGTGMGQRRLDLSSLSPNSYIPSWFQTPNTGQRLNMVEGVGA